MENKELIYIVIFATTAILPVIMANLLTKSLLRLLLAVGLILILYSIFWGDGITYISLFSQMFPESVRENIIQGYDYYRQQELFVLGWN